MSELSKLTVGVWDSGLMTSVAERIARDAGRVILFGPWMTEFPDPNLADIGSGLHNVERVKYFWDHKDECDFFVFPGVGFGDVQMELVRQGKKVWGSRKGEELELFRATTKEAMKTMGLAVNPYEIITGIQDLRKYIKENPGVFVKVSEFRGITESFEATNYELVEARLDQMEYEIGPVRKRTQEFIVEQPIPTKIETGGDHHAVVNGRFPENSAFGIEIKDALYLATCLPNNRLPQCVQELNKALSPIMREYGYLGPYHSEIRVGKNGKNYTIDHTCRFGSPCAEILEELFANFTEIIHQGVNGVLVEPEPTHKYGFQIAMYSDEATDGWLAVDYPPEIARFVKLYNHLKDENGMSWVVPTAAKLRQIGFVVGLGDTIEEAVRKGLENAEQVKADRLEIRSDAIPKLLDELRAAEAKGITFGDSPIPDKIST